MTNLHVDLAFRINASGVIPADHGYPLYGAISRAVPAIHELAGIGIHPIRGTQFEARQLSLRDYSRLKIRCSTEQIPAILQLAGKSLNLAGQTLRVGVPEINQLLPATDLRSRLVTVKLKDGLSEESFETGIRAQLNELGLTDEYTLELGRRRTLRIKNREIVGYELFLHGLSVPSSISIQASGVGGRRKMGCGLFSLCNAELAAKPNESRQ